VTTATFNVAEDALDGYGNNVRWHKHTTPRSCESGLLQHPQDNHRIWKTVYDFHLAQHRNSDYIPREAHCHDPFRSELLTFGSLIANANTATRVPLTVSSVLN
jgi:hypothetical protein